MPFNSQNGILDTHTARVRVMITYMRLILIKEQRLRLDREQEWPF
jgi:hypothetical protein